MSKTHGELMPERYYLLEHAVYKEGKFVYFICGNCDKRYDTFQQAVSHIRAGQKFSTKCAESLNIRHST